MGVGRKRQDQIKPSDASSMHMLTLGYYRDQGNFHGLPFALPFSLRGARQLLN